MIRGANFLVAGRAGMDLYADPPGAGVETAERFVAALGGSAANIAVGLTQLGCKASLITRVSDDAVGRFVLTQLDRYGINAAHIRAAGPLMRNSLAVTETRLENCQNVIYRNGAADLELTEDQFADVNVAAYAALVVTGTAFSAEPSRAACFTAMHMAGEAGTPIVLDIDFRATAWASKDAAREVCAAAAQASGIVVGNDEEFDVLAGTAGGGRTLAQDMAQRGGKTVVYKMGEKGSIVFSDTDVIETPIFPVAAIKPMGAGDAFMAGLLAALSQGRGLGDAVRRGSAAAAIVVSRFGCAPAMPTEAELETFLDKRRGEAA